MMEANPGLQRIAHLSLPQRRHLLGELLRRRLERPERFPLSFAQERVWLFERLHPGSAVYNIPLLLPLPGELDMTALERSYRDILNRHAVLRTVMTDLDGVPMQEVRLAPPTHLELLDLSELPQAEQDQHLRAALAHDARQPFDLTQGPLIRARVIRLDPRPGWLAVNMHHLVSDGWSLGIFARELHTLYHAHAQGRVPPLPELDLQFFDFVAWQREWLSGAGLRQLEEYWRARLAGAPRVLDLPTDHPRPPEQSFDGALFDSVLPKALAGALVRRAQAEQVTLFVLLLSAYAVLLYRYTGQDDMVIGVPMAGRVRTEFEPLIGFFVNNLALRIDLGGNPAFCDLLQRVHEAVLQAHEHQAYPFDKLVDLLGVKRDPSRAPIHQVVFNLQNNPTWGPMELDAEPSAPPLDAHSRTAKWDLNLALLGGAEGMAVSMEYCTALFDRSSIAAMIARFAHILEAVAADSSLRLLDIPLGPTSAPGRADGAAGEDADTFSF